MESFDFTALTYQYQHPVVSHWLVYQGTTHPLIIVCSNRESPFTFESLNIVFTEESLFD